MLDYLIVGLGLAGTCFSAVLEGNNKSFKAISDDSQQASVVAGGLYNPVILKRFTLAWQAERQMQESIPFYTELERKLRVKLDYRLRVLRRFASVEEQNLWFEASDKPGLNYFLSPKIVENSNPNIDASFGYGEVLKTGRVDTAKLLKLYTSYLTKQEKLLQEKFDYESLEVAEDHIAYKGLEAKKIVFAEGFGLKHNPFFNYLPLNGTKGELLTIKCPKLKEKNVIKSAVFIIPLGNDLYRVGATYKWKDKSNLPTEESKQELLTKLKTFLKCDFEVVDHVAGMRPTVTDRRPLVGMHPKYKNLYVLNGFGSRGILIGPYAAQQLYEFSIGASELDAEMDIVRFG